MNALIEKPTIVLVHGAFADTSAWAPVAQQLRAAGYTVDIPPIERGSLSEDSSYLKRFVEEIPAPVLLVGHSYGGAVITVAGTARNVIGLVYVAGFVPDEGESVGQLQAGFDEPELTRHLIVTPNTRTSGEPDARLSIEVEAYPSVVAAGLPSDLGRTLALAQQPIPAAAFGESATVAAWKRKPSFGIVTSADKAINPDVERYGYRRAGARKVIEINSSHLVMLTHPNEVARFITDALSDIA